MKKGFIAIFSMALLFTACGDSTEDQAKADKGVDVVVADTVVAMDTMVVDTVTTIAIDSAAREDYENDLSLEIKEIAEEIENPISDDCKVFLEDYAEGIKKYARVTEKVAADPENFQLQVDLNDAMDEISGWATKPQMFQCSQNEAFQKQVEILNEKRDKLLSI